METDKRKIGGLLYLLGLGLVFSMVVLPYRA